MVPPQIRHGMPWPSLPANGGEPVELTWAVVMRHLVHDRTVLLDAQEGLPDQVIEAAFSATGSSLGSRATCGTCLHQRVVQARYQSARPIVNASRGETAATRLYL